ncbi:hypothetical protein [Roseitranquillus sediminis]|uniref:hypothetical protein n=1 Tax=Roseitranquillus sediminis TaxID=2809051 RepID=UPI001D0C2717|nr:hypothetical protein [Roseitranquillus sediminis]MBM9595046.1 hypothetical protein [Roseitranquillus sediminis]
MLTPQSTRNSDASAATRSNVVSIAEHRRRWSGGGTTGAPDRQSSPEVRAAHVALVPYFGATIAFSHLHAVPWGSWTLGWALLWLSFLPLTFLLGGYLVRRVPLTFIGTILTILLAAFVTPLAVPPALTLLAVFVLTPAMARVIPW